MFFSIQQKNKLIKPGFIALAGLLAPFVFSAPDASAKTVVVKKANLGIIKGMVRDEQGAPISNAVVAIFRVGASKALKEVRSAADGSFLAKILPGTYSVLAVAEGFNSMTVDEVQVNRSAELSYGFKLERAGGGNTLPEKRSDRNNTKWHILAAQSRRSIYQNREGASPIDETRIEAAEENIAAAETEEESFNRRSQSVVETYFADSIDGSYQALNFATVQPFGENTEIIIAGQTGTNALAPTRFETTVKTRPNGKHQIQLKASAAKLGTIKDGEKQLGQVSVQALDEWKVRDGVIVVFGFDYSRFVGAGNDSGFSPRLGLQFDAGSKTRFHTSLTTQSEERGWARVIELEDSTVFFRDRIATESLAVEDEKPLMNKSRRLEFGVERVLDNNSNLEATAFFDAVGGRGVGLVNLPLDVLGADKDYAPFGVVQQGKTQGVRVVYTRRLGKTFSASAGYAVGRGQVLSGRAVSNPGNFLENSFFQTFVAQVNTDLKNGTQVKTIFRLSPQATVFAIDPFQGRLAIYDPSLSILITQPLPTLGLPIRAEAIIDARNVLDFQTGVTGEQGSLQLNSQRRTFRGGISLRF